jgi:hypothetical protein
MQGNKKEWTEHGTDGCEHALVHSGQSSYIKYNPAEALNNAANTSAMDKT